MKTNAYLVGLCFLPAGVIALAACYAPVLNNIPCRGAGAACQGYCIFGCGPLEGTVPPGPGQGNRSVCRSVPYGEPGLTCFNSEKCTYECVGLCTAHMAGFSSDLEGAANQGVGCPSCTGS